MTKRSALLSAAFLLAAAVLLLLFVGIHNAWDNVTFLVFVKRQRLGDEGRDRPGLTRPPIGAPSATLQQFLANSLDFFSRAGDP